MDVGVDVEEISWLEGGMSIVASAHDWGRWMLWALRFRRR